MGRNLLDVVSSIATMGEEGLGCFGSGRQHQAGQGEGEGGDLLLPEQVPAVPNHLLIYLSDQDKEGKTRSGGQPGAVQTGVQPGGGGPRLRGQLQESGSA